MDGAIGRSGRPELASRLVLDDRQRRGDRELNGRSSSHPAGLTNDHVMNAGVDRRHDHVRDEETALTVRDCDLKQRNVQVERNGRPTASFLVVTRGGAGRVADAQTFVDLINDSGESAQLLDANPDGHDDVSVQLGASGEQVVTTEITGFLQSCLAATATPAPAA
jgi:hypothetical protein